MCVPCTLSMGSATTYVATCSARVFVTPTKVMTGIYGCYGWLTSRLSVGVGIRKCLNRVLLMIGRVKENQPFGWHPFLSSQWFAYVLIGLW